MAEDTVTTPSADADNTEPATVAPDTAAPDTTAPDAAAGSDRGARKVREGLVVSNKMEKTAVVAVIERVRHPKYGKFMMRTKKLYAHDETNDANIGDKVRVMETRPLSKNKRWRVVEILERAK
ncbi:MAG: small subunit ribosomal protein S17 [Acidimicrobiaceae bacterium]|nr:MAG: small subunit ribosomal protein S17 [Acidimicrobiaceae bacterium]